MFVFMHLCLWSGACVCVLIIFQWSSFSTQQRERWTTLVRFCGETLCGRKQNNCDLCKNTNGKPHAQNMGVWQCVCVFTGVRLKALMWVASCRRSNYSEDFARRGVSSWRGIKCKVQLHLQQLTQEPQTFLFRHRVRRSLEMWKQQHDKFKPSYNFFLQLFCFWISTEHSFKTSLSYIWSNWFLLKASGTSTAV